MLVAGVALLGAAPASSSAAPRVHAMMWWRDGGVTGPREMTLGSLRVGRCSIGEGSPLAVLRGFDKPFRVRGSCESLYVFQVGRDRERGAGGWVYKVGRRLPSRSASDPTGVLRSGQRLVWFWCRQAGNCQRTLAMAAPRSVRRGVRFRVTVRGYDDFGRGRRIRGAVVRSGGGTSARTDARGEATFRATRPGRVRLVATRRGMIRSFSSVVTVR